MEFRKLILSIVQSAIKPANRRGQATNINLDKCTCDVDLGNGAMLHQVKLKATEGSQTKGIVIVPKDKSYVVAGMAEGLEADWCLVSVEEIDSAAFFYKNGGKLEMKDNGEIHLNGDNCGPLIKIDELVNKINRLEDKHNALADEFNSHIHTNGNNGANTGGPTVPSSSKISGLTTANDLKNDKVKHGG